MRARPHSKEAPSPKKIIIIINYCQVATRQAHAHIYTRKRIKKSCDITLANWRWGFGLETRENLTLTRIL